MRIHLTKVAAAILALAVAGLPALAQTREVRESAELAPGGSVTVETFKGSIRVTTWNQDKVEIVARIEADTDTSRAYAELAVEATEVDFYSTARSVTIRSDYSEVPCEEDLERSSRRNNCSKSLPFIHYEIRAPRSLNLTIDDHKSEISVTGIEGSLRLDTHRGKVDLNDIQGTIRLETHRGTVTAAGLNGDVVIDTHRGRIDASEISGSLRLSSHRGTAMLTGVSGRVNVDTYRGNVRMDIVRLDGGSRLSTYRGNIRLKLPSSQKLSVEGEIGRRGDFESDFEMTMRKLDRERFEAEINGGGPRLRVKTTSGEIRLVKQP